MFSNPSANHSYEIKSIWKFWNLSITFESDFFEKICFFSKSFTFTKVLLQSHSKKSFFGNCNRPLWMRFSRVLCVARTCNTYLFGCLGSYILMAIRTSHIVRIHFYWSKRVKMSFLPKWYVDELCWQLTKWTFLMEKSRTSEL